MASALALTDEVAVPIRAVGDLAAAADVSREEVAVITQCASLGWYLAPHFLLIKLEVREWIVWIQKPIDYHPSPWMFEICCKGCSFTNQICNARWVLRISYINCN